MQPQWQPAPPVVSQWQQPPPRYYYPPAPPGTVAVVRPQKPAPVTRPQADVPAELVAASVRVAVTKRDGSGIGGSGTIFHVEPDGELAYVITNRHVVGSGDEGDISIFLPSGQVYECAFFGKADGPDLTVLAFRPQGKVPFVPVAERSPQEGEDVWQVGYPHGKLTRRSGKSHGMVSYIAKPPAWNVELSFSSDQGDSGSGVFNKDRKLCAVVWGGRPGTPACCVPQGYINEACFRLGIFGRRGGGIGLDIKRRVAPTVPVVPAQPPPLPPGSAPPMPPAVQAPADSSGSLAAMEARLADMISKIPAGRDGKDGTPGRDGKDGAAGQPGASPDLTALAARIAALENRPTVTNPPEAPTRVRVVPAAQ